MGKHKPHRKSVVARRLNSGGKSWRDYIRLDLKFAQIKMERKR